MTDFFTGNTDSPRIILFSKKTIIKLLRTALRLFIGMMRYMFLVVTITEAKLTTTWENTKSRNVRVAIFGAYRVVEEEEEEEEQPSNSTTTGDNNDKQQRCTLHVFQLMDLGGYLGFASNFINQASYSDLYDRIQKKFPTTTTTTTTTGQRGTRKQQ